MSFSAVLFLFLFFVGILGAVFYHGSLAFIVYQLVYFFNAETRWWYSDIPGLRYSFIAVIIMMLLLAKDYSKLSKSSPWFELAPFKWMAALLVMYYLAYTFAIDFDYHHKFTFEFTKLIIIIFVAYKLINSKLMLDTCLWGYITGCAYIGYVATITGRNSGDRLEGIGMIDAPDSNDTAAALAPAAVLLIYFAWKGNYKIKIISAVMGAFIANALVLINSRGSFLGVVASLGVFLMFMIFSKYQEKGQRKTAILMIILGLSGALYVTDDLFWERMNTLTNTQDEKASGASRMTFWFTTFDMLRDHPQGLGVYGYNRLAPYYMDDETRGGVLYRSVHSMWFQGLAEVGWLGFAFFLMMLFALVKLSKKTKRYVLDQQDYNSYFKIMALECALLAYLTAGTFINRFRAEVLYWMILFILVVVKLYFIQPSKEKN